MSYIVTDNGPLDHNGVIYNEGDEVSGLEEGQAARLLELGVIHAKPTQSKREKND